MWHKYHLLYFKIVSNFTHLTACEITYNNFEISLVILPIQISPCCFLPPKLTLFDLFKCLLGNKRAKKRKPIMSCAFESE